MRLRFFLYLLFISFKMENLKGFLGVCLFCAFTIAFGQQNQTETAYTNRVYLLWDASSSMSARNIEAELTYLDTYFTQHPNVEVTLIKFNYQEIFKKIYQIINSDWEELSQELLNTVYDGATSLSWIKQTTFSNPTLLFSDQKESFVTNKTVLPSTITRVNETTTSTAPSPKKEVFKGFVYTSDGPIPGVTISLKGQNKKVVTDSAGAYRIEAQIGDVLVFEYLNYPKKEVSLGAQTQHDMLIEKGTYALKEVTVTEKKTEKETVTTGYGQENKDKVGYMVESVKADEISAIETDVSSALTGKISGVNVPIDNGPDMARTIIRGMKSIKLQNSPLIVLDGVPLRRTDETGAPGSQNFLSDTRFLDPSNIAEITVLKGLAATNRYGSEGGNGVIIITTKTGYFKASPDANQPKKEAPEFVPYTPENPFYLADLQSAEDHEALFEKYMVYKNLFGNTPEFYLNAYKIFNDKNPDKAFQVISNLIELFPDKLPVLKAMTFVLEAAGDVPHALEVAQIINSRFPGQTQSQLQLANLQYLNKNNQAAYEAYMRLRDSHLNAFALKKQLLNGIKSSVAKDAALIQNPQVPSFAKRPVNYPYRIVVEWSHAQAAFNLQFVDPANNYINLENYPGTELYTENRNQQYFTIESVIEEGSPKGRWLANIKRTDEIVEIVYFKITVFKDFGTNTESLQTQVFALKPTDANVNVWELVY